MWLDCAGESCDADDGAFIDAEKFDVRFDGAEGDSFDTGGCEDDVDVNWVLM